MSELLAVCKFPSSAIGPSSYVQRCNGGIAKEKSQDELQCVDSLKTNPLWRPGQFANRLW